MNNYQAETQAERDLEEVYISFIEALESRDFPEAEIIAATMINRGSNTDYLRDKIDQAREADRNERLERAMSGAITRMINQPSPRQQEYGEWGDIRIDRYEAERELKALEN